jgi:hypothetical protein
MVHELGTIVEKLAGLIQPIQNGPTQMKHCRRFTVLDGMILIAAFAVGLAWMLDFQNCEAGGESYPDREIPMVGTVTAFRYRVEVVAWWVVSLTYLVAVITIALLILRLRGTPRKQLRRLTRLPGTVASGAVCLTVLWDLAQSAMEGTIGSWKTGFVFPPWQCTYMLVSGRNATVAVAATWVLLWTSGRWRHEPGWLDNVGIGLGIFWLLQSLLTIIAHLPYVSFMGFL